MPDNLKQLSPNEIQAGQLEKVQKLAENTIKLLETVNVSGSGAFFLVDSIAWLTSMKESCQSQLKRLEEKRAESERDAQKAFVKSGKRGKANA